MGTFVHQAKYTNDLMKKFNAKRFSKFAFAPSSGASGGILMCWNESLLEGEIISMQSFAISQLQVQIK
jgi:hypothetical protein